MVSEWKQICSLFVVVYQSKLPHVGTTYLNYIFFSRITVTENVLYSMYLI